MTKKTTTKAKMEIDLFEKKYKKQIEMMTQNTIDIYGSVKGIAGSSVKEIKELGFDDLLLDESGEE